MEGNEIADIPWSILRPLSSRAGVPANCFANGSRFAEPQADS